MMVLLLFLMNESRFLGEIGSTREWWTREVEIIGLGAWWWGLDVGESSVTAGIENFGKKEKRKRKKDLGELEWDWDHPPEILGVSFHFIFSEWWSLAESIHSVCLLSFVIFFPVDFFRWLFLFLLLLLLLSPHSSPKWVPPAPSRRNRNPLNHLRPWARLQLPNLQRRPSLPRLF